MNKPKRAKKLVRGRDWHAWVWKWHEDGKLSHLVNNGERDNYRNLHGKWVRVKFVEVKCRKRK